MPGEAVGTEAGRAQRNGTRGGIRRISGELRFRRRPVKGGEGGRSRKAGALRVARR